MASYMKADNAAADIEVVGKAGSGRTFVIFSERAQYSELTRKLFSALSSGNKTLLLECSEITDNNWANLTQILRETLEKEGVRSASFIGVSSAACVILHLALRELKLFRTLVLIDATTRPHPSFRDRIINRIESFLPLGLPLRSQSAGFDAKSFLQRVRCPVLIVTTLAAGPYIRSQAAVFESGLPTGWVKALSTTDETAELTACVIDFQQVPAKLPQKNAA